MTANEVLDVMTSGWFVFTVFVIFAAVVIGIGWVRRPSEEETLERFRQRAADPEFGTRSEPLHRGSLDAYRRGQWYAFPQRLTSRWGRYREQNGILVLSNNDAPAPNGQERDVIMFDGGEWVQTHTYGPEITDPGTEYPQVSTLTRESKLPIDLRWNKRGANPVQLNAADSQGEHFRQLMLETDRRLRRATALWRWGYRAALLGLLGCLLLIPLGASISAPAAALAVIGALLLLPVSLLLRWLRITALRRRGAKVLTAEPELYRAAAWVNQEVLAQWRAGGHDFWEFGPALPPALAWSWRKDPRKPIIIVLAILGVFGVIFAAITVALILDWLGGAFDFPLAMVITTAVFVLMGIAAGLLMNRPENDYTKFGELMDQLRHGEDTPSPQGVPPWPPPQTGSQIITKRHEDLHEQVKELYHASRPWRPQRERIMDYQNAGSPRA